MILSPKTNNLFICEGILEKKQFSLHKKNLIVLLVIAFFTAADQIIKHFVYMNLKDGEVFSVIPKILQFRFVENPDAMMGMDFAGPKAMIVLSVVCFAAVSILIFMGKIKNKVDYVSLVMILSGGLGNIIDRIFRGYVVDYIEVLFVDFYVFNFADCLVTVGAFLLLFNQIYQIIREQKAKKGEASDG